jgi:hypothetical protein
MISSQEFYQKLQAGQINEALALAIQAASELDITTRMTDELPDRRSFGHEYFRTKINLLTGNVEHEVSKKVITDSNSYLKLQQLHIDRVAESHRLVRGYLQQIQAILTALPPPSNIPETDLTQTPDRLSFREAFAEAKASPTPTTRTAAAPVEESQFDFAPELDDELDLSVDREGEVWEEWVEDEDFQLETGAPQLRTTPPISILADRPQYPANRPLNPLTIKPIALRSTAIPVDISGWDKFAPEYIQIDAVASPRQITSGDLDRLDDLLADLDI